MTIIACLAAGCSFVFMKRLPAHPQPGADCTSSYALPATDAVAAVLTGALAVTFHSAAQPAPDQTNNLDTYAWVSTGIAVAAIASAGYGALEANRCRSVTKPAPSTTYREDAPTPGTLGGKCRPDGGCDGELICDKPMHTCIRIDEGNDSNRADGGS